MRFLRAAEISTLSSRGIIIRNQFRPTHCEGISYSLTLGHHVQSISKTEENYRRINGSLTLEPREAVNVEINEKFNFCDADGRPRYFGFILAGARLLAGGVSHPATFIDPGFRLTTTLTLVNLRNFPSRAFRPGSDKIAKLLVVEFDEDETPESWDATPAYREAGPDQPPVLWADFHMMPPWSPVRRPVPDAMERLEAYGPPFDLIAWHLQDQQEMLSAPDGSKISLTQIVAELNTSLNRSERVVQLMDQRLELLESSFNELNERTRDALRGVADLKDSIQREREQRNRQLVENRRYRFTVTIAIVSTIIAAASVVVALFIG